MVSVVAVTWLGAFFLTLARVALALSRCRSQMAAILTSLSASRTLMTAPPPRPPHPMMPTLTVWLPWAYRPPEKARAPAAAAPVVRKSRRLTVSDMERLLVDSQGALRDPGLWSVTPSG